MIKKCKPTSPGRRGMTVLNYRLTLKPPKKLHRPLLEPLKKHAGRNHHGRITTRHQGGGVRRHYRLVDYKRTHDGIPGTIKTIEYDPNRTANISLVVYANGKKQYVLTPRGAKIGAKILSGKKADILPGNCLQLRDVPDGALVHNIEFYPGHGGQIARAAGSYGRIVGRDDNNRYVIVRLRSGETRRILATCRATIGSVGNVTHSLVKIGKAGRNRRKNVRPTVRGSAMNRNDHPHGGGEGKAPVGRKSPMTPWGKKALGVSTRSRKKPSSRLIVRRRNNKKHGGQ